LLYFQPEGKHAAVRVGGSLLEAAQVLGVDISATCGGVGTCGKCKVLVKDGRALLGLPTSIEETYFRSDDLSYGFRLACETRTNADGLIVVEVPPESRGSKNRLQSEGLETPVKLEPSVRSFLITVETSSLDAHEALFEKVTRSLLNCGITIKTVDHDCLVGIGGTLKDSGWSGSAFLYDDTKLVSLEEGSPRSLGMAVDVGTTKLAGYLMDLVSGKLLTKVSRVNPQVLYGEDVMSRLTYILNEKEGCNRLTSSIRGAINEMVVEACDLAKVPLESLREVVIVGNTLMHHLVAGIEPSSLGFSPYSPVIDRSYEVEGRKIGLKGGRGLVAYMLPNVAGFVGADCVADVISTGLQDAKGTQLLVDIGTNTEMVCCHGSNLWCASSPSGPAFEGAHIKHGMRAMSGAIEHVSIDKSLNIKYSTIDDLPAKGICGSGVVDVVCEMLDRGIMDRSGRMSEEKSITNVVRDSDGVQCIISRHSENAIGKDITFTQKDVREVQKVKAAIAAGTKIIMNQAGISVHDIERVYVAGAFGAYMDVSSAVMIGMLPATPLHKVMQIGNAAGTGARMCLLSRQAKSTAETVAKKMKYVELSARPEFLSTYLKSLEFGPFA
jgi:uncharacterized 2Fe-2S/4Fe-4S cluster protein (DUF4445 family)